MAKPIPKRIVHKYMNVLIDCSRRGTHHIGADNPALFALREREDFDTVINYLESLGLVNLFRASEMDPIITLTDQGMTYLETDRDLVRERRWTRGLAIAAIMISIGSLIVSVIALIR